MDTGSATYSHISVNNKKGLSYKCLKAIKSIILRFIPTSLKLRYRNFLFLKNIFDNYFYDFNRFIKWSGLGSKVEEQTKLKALITMDYHRIEKGLSLRNPHHCFGRQVIERLLKNLEEYKQIFGWESVCNSASSALFCYHDFNRKSGHDDDQLYQRLTILCDPIANQCKNEANGGIEIIKRE